MRPGLYSLVSDRISESEFTASVDAVREAWDGLLDQEAAAQLVAQQLGADLVAYTAIAEIQEGLETTLRGTIEEVSPVREFLRKDETRGRVANVVLRDSTGACRVVLWDDDVEWVTSRKMVRGRDLRLVDAFVKRTNFGLEVSRGKFGAFQVL